MGIDARTPVPTVAGWRPAEMIKAGDEVFNYLGKPVKVTSVQTYTPPECYKVWFQDGLTLVADWRTGLPVITERQFQVFRQWSRKRPQKSNIILPRSPREIMEGAAGVCRIINSRPIQPHHRNLPVEPFEFGQWTMDRSPKRKARFTSTLLDWYGEVPKYIPDTYLFASFEQRLTLLRGIVSTRPNVYKPNTTWFHMVTRDQQKARNWQNLTESLGIRTMLNYDGGGKWNLRFKTTLRLLPEQTAPTRYPNHECRTVKKIVLTETRPLVHIQTEAKENSIILSEGFINVCL